MIPINSEVHWFRGSMNVAIVRSYSVTENMYFITPHTLNLPKHIRSRIEIPCWQNSRDYMDIDQYEKELQPCADKGFWVSPEDLVMLKMYSKYYTLKEMVYELDCQLRFASL